MPDTTNDTHVCTTVALKALDHVKLPSTREYAEVAYSPDRREAVVKGDDMAPLLVQVGDGDPKLVDASTTMGNKLDEYIKSSANSVEKIDDNEKQIGASLRKVGTCVEAVSSCAVAELCVALSPISSDPFKDHKNIEGDTNTDYTAQLAELCGLLQNDDADVIKANREAVVAKAARSTSQCEEALSAVSAVAAGMQLIRLEPLADLDDAVRTAEKQTQAVLDAKAEFEKTTYSALMEVKGRQEANAEEMGQKLAAIQKLFGELNDHAQKGKELEEEFNEKEQTAVAARKEKVEGLEKLVLEEDELRQENAVTRARINMRKATDELAKSVNADIYNARQHVEKLKSETQSKAAKLLEDVKQQITTCMKNVEEVVANQTEFKEAEQTALDELADLESDEATSMHSANVRQCNRVIDAAKLRLDVLGSELTALP